MGAAETYKTKSAFEIPVEVSTVGIVWKEHAEVLPTTRFLTTGSTLSLALRRAIA